MDDTGKFSVGGKSPLTQGVKESDVGGEAGKKIARLGIKALMLEDIPEKPVTKVLTITANQHTLSESPELKGKQVSETIQILRKQFGSQVGIICIGPAGEMKMTGAGVAVSEVNDIQVRYAARGGLGAVMGSKGIKAIVVDDSDAVPPPVFNEALLLESSKALAQAILADPNSQLNQDMPGTYYEFGQHFKDGGEGTRLAKVRNQELECTRRIMTGASDCCAFRSGFVFTLEGHYRKGMDGDYLLVAVSHSGSQGSLFASALSGKAPTYANEFVCIPADVQFRPPRRTKEPIILGVMTARVESSGGQYAHLDDEGRYRVKMHFDLSGKGQATASRSIRLAQPYTGSNYGIHFPACPIPSSGFGTAPARRSART